MFIRPTELPISGPRSTACLRHVFCTTALFTGKLDATDVSRMAGDANYRITLNNFLHAATTLADACVKLRQYCIEGTELNRDQIGTYVNWSLMLVTALSPVIGYDKAAAIAHQANDQGTTLREAALASGYINGKDFDRIVDPAAMTGLRQRLLSMSSRDRTWQVDSGNRCP